MKTPKHIPTTVPIDKEELDAEVAAAELVSSGAAVDELGVWDTLKTGVVPVKAAAVGPFATSSELVLAPAVWTVVTPDKLAPTGAAGIEETCRRCTRCMLMQLCARKERQGLKDLR